MISDLNVRLLLICSIVILLMARHPITAQINDPIQEQMYTMHPIGKVVKKDNRNFIEVFEQYQNGLYRLDQFEEVTVIYWFDKNDTPEKRAILQVHPRGDKNNPIRGVFATHAPVRPNLIAISRCKILRIEGNIIEVDEIDAFDQTPVLDLKN